MKTYEFISDPGHGWLRVPLADLPLGYYPSEYSYTDGQYAYLEEDVDANTFLAAIGGTIQYNIVEKYEEVTRIRNMPRFEARA